MQQYSPKNQAFLLAQMPTATDVRPFKAWNAAGRSIIKGEKALRVWIPKRGKAIPADLSTMTEAQEREYFVRGPVFDISQTQPTKPNVKRQREQQSILSEHRHEQAWTDYAAAIDAGDIPADLDFADWYELREDSIRVAAGCASNVGASDYADYTIATDAGTIIAQVEHHDIYAPIGGGSQELDTIEEETAPAVSEPQQHEARITFHNAAGQRLQDLVFVTRKDADTAFDAIENGTAANIPADWLTATLETFINHSPYTERATYRHTGNLTDQYRAEFLELGARSYQWSSHTPDKRAASDFTSFRLMIEKQSCQWHAKATTPEMHALADTLAADYAAGYMAQYRNVAAARSRVASSFVTGGSGFNVRRNQKAQATYAKRYDELDAWMQQFQKNATKQLAAHIPADDKIAQELKGAARRNLIMCGQIDAGQWPGFNRQSFANSTASRIRTAHKRGHTEAVAAVLAWLKEEQTNLLATGHLKTPMLTDRHSIWTLA